MLRLENISIDRTHYQLSNFKTKIDKNEKVFFSKTKAAKRAHAKLVHGKL